MNKSKEEENLTEEVKKAKTWAKNKLLHLKNSKRADVEEGQTRVNEGRE